MQSWIVSIVNLVLVENLKESHLFEVLISLTV